MWFIWLLAFNIGFVIHFGHDTEIYSWHDVKWVLICSVLPVIPTLYLVKWCDNFVRGIEG